MNVDQILAAAAGAAGSSFAQSVRSENGDSDFEAILKKYDEEKKLLDEEARERREAEERIREDKRERDDIINELRGLVARYKQKAMAGGDGAEGAAAMVSQLENKIFWLMFDL